MPLDGLFGQGAVVRGKLGVEDFCRGGVMGFGDVAGVSRANGRYAEYNCEEQRKEAGCMVRRV